MTPSTKLRQGSTSFSTELCRVCGEPACMVILESYVYRKDFGYTVGWGWKKNWVEIPYCRTHGLGMRSDPYDK